MRKFFLPALLAFALTVSAPAKPVDLTPYKGVYTGTATYTNLAGGIEGTGPMTAAFNTSKNGRTGTLALFGTVSLNGLDRTLTENLTFANGKLGVSDLGPLLIAPQAISGTYKGQKKKKTLISTIPWTYNASTTGTDTITIDLKTGKARHTLTVTLVLGVNGDLSDYLTITWTGTRKK